MKKWSKGFYFLAPLLLVDGYDNKYHNQIIRTTLAKQTGRHRGRCPA